MKRTTITLPEDLADLVAREARRRETTISALVRQLIADGLGSDETEPRVIPWAALFHDPDMISAEHLEDALAQGWVDDIDRDRG